MKLTTIFLLFSLAANSQSTILIPSNTTIAQAQTLINSANNNDIVSFQSGGKWVGGLMLNASKTGITYNAYGTGQKPVITNKTLFIDAMTASNWSRPFPTAKPNVWVMTIPSYAMTQYVDRIWCDSVEQTAARIIMPNDCYVTTGPTELTAEGQMINNTALCSQLYLYSTTNPATRYSKITWTGAIAAAGYVINSNGAQNFTIDGIAIEGGQQGSIGLINSSSVTIKNCNIGWGAMHDGIVQSGFCRYLNFLNNVIDAGVRQPNWAFAYQVGFPQAGIYLQSGAFDILAKGNDIKDWTHAGVDLEPYYYYGTPDTLYTMVIGGTRYHLANITIDGNLIEGPDVAYMRGFGAVMPKGRNSIGIKFLRNRIKNCPIHSQISMSGIEVAYNEFSDNIRTKVVPNSYGQFGGISMNGSQEAQLTNQSVHNNTFVNLADPAIKFIWGFNLAIGSGNISTNASSKIVTATGASFTTQFAVGDYLIDNSYQNVIGRVASIQGANQLTLVSNARLTVLGQSGWQVATVYDELAYNKVYNNIVVNCGYNPSQPELLYKGIITANIYNPYPVDGPTNGYEHDNEFKNNVVYSPNATQVIYDSRQDAASLTVTEWQTLGNGFKADVVTGNLGSNPQLHNIGAAQYWPDATALQTGGVTYLEATGLDQSSVWPSGVVTKAQATGAWAIGAFMPATVVVPPPPPPPPPPGVDPGAGRVNIRKPIKVLQ